MQLRRCSLPGPRCVALLSLLSLLQLLLLLLLLLFLWLLLSWQPSCSACVLEAKDSTCVSPCIHVPGRWWHLTAHQPDAVPLLPPSLLLLSLLLQKFLTAARSSVQVTAVTFGAPNVGDATFVSDYNSRVNTRNVQFFADIVTQVRGLAACVCSVGCSVSMSGTVATVLVLWCVALFLVGWWCCGWCFGTITSCGMQTLPHR